jgi:hypothetical protein
MLDLSFSHHLLECNTVVRQKFSDASEEHTASIFTIEVKHVVCKKLKARNTDELLLDYTVLPPRNFGFQLLEKLISS